MQRKIFIIIFLISINIFGQKSEIENLINHISENEIPENFEYYFLVSKSLEQPKIYDSIQHYHIGELRTTKNDQIVKLYYQKNDEKVDWKDYDLKNVKFVINEYNYPTTSPPTSKNIRFVKYNIEQKEYDSLTQNRKPNTIIVRKKWLWKKNKIERNKKFHNELIKAWKLDEEKNKEEKVYFQFSKPIFSKDNKYARISIFINRRCNGNGFTAIYKNDNGTWKKLIEYNKVGSIVSTSHSKCGSISYYE
ncbi:hypothetical protein [Formosa maritima]|uniref:Uncharacterized protein n=1 Tax=Formosa maritima TaxID=2592046 RepID=A0A5D0G255_9FLAO|nr:hypothetical protein [Formosa maritima]TYA52731.1 hypothetical protein FVF61_11865 [Formosa maritima]